MFTFNGKSYELPKKTMELNDLIESINSSKSTREAYELMYDFINKALDEDTIIEALETNDINEMDLVQLNLLCNAINCEYEKEIFESQMKILEKRTNSKAFDKAIQVGKVLEHSAKLKK